MRHGMAGGAVSSDKRVHWTAEPATAHVAPSSRTNVERALDRVNWSGRGGVRRDRRGGRLRARIGHDGSPTSFEAALRPRMGSTPSYWWDATLTLVCVGSRTVERHPRRTTPMQRAVASARPSSCRTRIETKSTARRRPPFSSSYGVSGWACGSIESTTSQRPNPKRRQQARRPPIRSSGTSCRRWRAATQSST